MPRLATMMQRGRQKLPAPPPRDAFYGNHAVSCANLGASLSRFLSSQSNKMVRFLTTWRGSTHVLDGSCRALVCGACGNARIRGRLHDISHWRHWGAQPHCDHIASGNFKSFGYRYRECMATDAMQPAETAGLQPFLASLEGVRNFSVQGRHRLAFAMLSRARLG